MRLALVVLSAILLCVALASMIAPYDPMQTNTQVSLAAPNTTHLLGTDLLGRDVLSRVLHGGQRTLIVAIGVVAVATLPTTLPTLLFVILGGIWDRLVGITINVVLAIPALLLSLVILTLAGRGWSQIVLAVGVALSAPYMRVLRSAILQVMAMPYIEGARASGAGTWWIAIHHVLPNVMTTVGAYLGVMFSYAIINAAALSFLGLGGPPGSPEWGAILAEGRLVFQQAPWVSIAPGILIVLTVMSVNAIVDMLVERKYHL